MGRSRKALRRCGGVPFLSLGIEKMGRMRYNDIRTVVLRYVTISGNVKE